MLLYLEYQPVQRILQCFTKTSKIEIRQKNISNKIEKKCTSSWQKNVEQERSFSLQFMSFDHVLMVKTDVK